MIETKDFGDYCVKAVKSFEGSDGYGFNANLYRGKKKIAFVRDMGCGGEVDIDWLIEKLPKPEREYDSEKEYKKAWAKYKAERQEEIDLLKAHVATLPSVKSNFFPDQPLKIDMGWFITDCVSKWELDKEVKKIAKQCKTKTLFRTPTHNSGQYASLNHVCDDRVRDHLRMRYGNDVEIFNDIIEQGKVPSVFVSLHQR